MKLFFVIIANSILLVGCSGASVNTNLDSFAKHQYRMVAVKEYSFQQMNIYQAESLGGVSANYCQQKIGQPKANQSALIEELKGKVYQKGGNGLVVEQCRSPRNRACKSYTECYGIAYRVPAS